MGGVLGPWGGLGSNVAVVIYFSAHVFSGIQSHCTHTLLTHAPPRVLGLKPSLSPPGALQPHTTRGPRTTQRGRSGAQGRECATEGLSSRPAILSDPLASPRSGGREASAQSRGFRMAAGGWDGGDMNVVIAAIMVCAVGRLFPKSEPTCTTCSFLQVEVR